MPAVTTTIMGSYRSPDEQRLKQAREEEIPQVRDYLEGGLPADGFVFGAISVADIALTAFFRDAAFARYAIDAARWQRTVAIVARALDHVSFAKLRPDRLVPLSAVQTSLCAVSSVRRRPKAASRRSCRRGSCPGRRVAAAPGPRDS